MNKHQYAYMIRNEISRLNKRIDDKIFMGYSYEHDAKRHKMLLARLHRLNRRERLNSLAKALFAGSKLFAKTALTLF